MTVVLWIVQGLLALAYLMAGGTKASRPIAALSKSMAWVRSVPPGFVRFIGVAEVLGAIGIILPLATGVLPWLAAPLEHSRPGGTRNYNGVARHVSLTPVHSPNRL